jgi:alkylhydroperoxidase family enzyme
MARIDYPDASDAALAPLIDRIRTERGGKLLNLYRMLLHSPPFALGWLNFFTAVRQQGRLDARYRELAILRIAVLNDADYEFTQHIPHALKAGCSEAQIQAVKHDRESAVFDDRERAVLAYADAMTRDVEVPDATFDRIRAIFDERDVLELSVTIGGYNMVSRVLVALRIDHG